MADDLGQIATITDQRKRNREYKAKLDEFIKAGNSADLERFVTHMVKEENRAQLNDFALKSVDIKDADVMENVCKTALKHMESKVIFDIEAGNLRRSLASLYEKQNKTNAAIMTLAKIKMDGHRAVPDEDKLRTYLRIAGLQIASDDMMGAESYLSRANEIANRVADPVLHYQLQDYQAQVLDSSRRFLQASQKYYALSQSAFLEEEKVAALSASLTCAVLGKAGPSRARALGTLFKDERSPKIKAYGILEKMYLGRVVRQEDLAVFKEHLKPHHLQKSSDGEGTLLDRAVREHNLLACSKIYKNISFAQLGSLLNVSPESAEKIAAQMIIEERMSGFLDQEDGVIIFSDAEPLEAWDRGIESVCNEVNFLADRIAASYPDLVVR